MGSGSRGLEERWLLVPDQLHGGCVTLTKMTPQDEQEHPFHSWRAEAGGVQSLAQVHTVAQPQVPASSW